MAEFRPSVIHEVLVTESNHLLMQYEFASSPSVKNLFGLPEPLEHELTLPVSSALSAVGDEKEHQHSSCLFLSCILQCSRSCLEIKTIVEFELSRCSRFVKNLLQIEKTHQRFVVRVQSKVTTHVVLVILLDIKNYCNALRF